MRRIPMGLWALAVLFLCIGTMTFALVGCVKKDVAQTETKKEMLYTCPMHPTYLSHEPGKCPICGMTLVPVLKNNVENETGVKIDPAMVQSIGVQTEKAALRTLSRDIRATATIMPDERRVSIITTKVMGYVEKLFVDYTGQPVKVGQPLYSLYSPDLVSAQAEYLQVFKNIDSKDSGQLLRSARKRLMNWDITDDQIEKLEKRGTPERALTMVSPAAGLVADKMVSNGQTIEPGMQLYKLIDYSRVWVEAAIYQQDVPLVNVGQKATIDLDYYPGEHFTGTVTYIAPELNMDSRTLKVRLETPNTPNLKIKPGMNASVTLHSTINKKALTVPDQAIIRSGLRTLVVVAKGNGYFQPREIKIGRTAGGFTEVLAGVSEAEDIVVSSQFLIDSESNLKAAIMKMSDKKTE